MATAPKELLQSPTIVRPPRRQGGILSQIPEMVTSVLRPKSFEEQFSFDSESEAKDLGRVHQQLVSLLTPGLETSEDLSFMAKAITDALDRLSPKATLIFAPVILDFQYQAVAELKIPQTEDSSTNDGVVEKLYDYISSATPEDLSKLGTALHISHQRLQSSVQQHTEQESLVRKDAVKGYRNSVLQAAQFSEIIASQGPRDWQSWKEHPEIAASGISDLLDQASKTVFQGYETSLENSKSTTAIVRASAAKLRRLNSQLQQAASLYAASQVASHSFNSRDLLNLMIDASRSAKNPTIQKIKKVLEKVIGNPPRMSSY